MNILEKAQLIKELHQLIADLESRQLSFFEIARSKKRIRDIFELCDEPRFQKQLEAYKAITQPQASAEHWIKQSAYQHLYVGLFQYESALEEALQKHASFAWGVLYKSGLGWQVYFRNNDTMLHSSAWFPQFKQAYHWLTAHPQAIQSLHSAPALSKAAPVSIHQPVEAMHQQKIETEHPVTPLSSSPTISLEQEFEAVSVVHTHAALEAPSFNQAMSAVPFEIEAASITDHLTQEQPVTAAERSDIDSKTESVQTLEDHSTLHPNLTGFDLLEPKTSWESTSHSQPLSSLTALDEPVDVPDWSLQTDHNAFLWTHSTSVSTTQQRQSRAQKAMPPPPSSAIAFDRYQARLSAFGQPNLAGLYRIEWVEYPDINVAVDWILQADRVEQRLDGPIYVSEQIDASGHFIRYLAVFGAENVAHGIQMSLQFAQDHSHQLAAIRSVEWNKFNTALSDVISIFQIYTQHATVVWQSEYYHPFILANLIHSHKFIQFEEAPADVHTPILLLKERQKIRIIHGQNRIGLSTSEVAYPYLLLDRQNGVNWQLIQSALATLSEPINVFQLFDSIEEQISTEL